MERTVAIIGAGPIGLAAAVAAKARGFEPIVFEAGATPGAALVRFGPTRFFSPLAMNLPEALASLAREALGSAMPPDDALLSGPEMAHVLAATARTALLAPHVHCNHRVTQVTRRNLSRGQHAGHPVRAELPFHVVVTTPNGARTFEVDAILDASGTYGTPVPLPGRGADAPAIRDAAIRDLGALHAQLSELAGRRILLAGHGHSAANALGALAALTERHPGTRVVFAVRSRNLRPFEVVSSDPLPERARVIDEANRLVSKPPPWLTVERNAPLLGFALAERPTGIAVSLGGGREVEVDRIVALLGYRPDLTTLSELPLEIAPATEGALRLAHALANVTDCLTPPKVSPADLASGEPRFHMVGAKSYGRARTFLLRTGYGQLETILDGLFDT